MQHYLVHNIQLGNNTLMGDVVHHLSKVLRMQINDTLVLVDGNGKSAIATIAAINKKDIIVNVVAINNNEPSNTTVCLGIAFTKNASKIEWLVEKAVELGVHAIYPLHTTRTENIYPKYDRLNYIIEAAFCQSKQYYLPILHPITKLEALINNKNFNQILVAHCLDYENKKALKQIETKNKSSLILIGPEGDFTPEEIHLCQQANAIPVQLGNTRLRTETAALKALSIIIDE
jgi:16S rRNA (uracil1498-N3)-methyltransferase